MTLKGLRIALRFIALLLAINTASAACIGNDDVYEIAGGNYPDEFRWKGQHYVHTCDSPGFICSPGWCTIGESCSCGTSNGRPLLGKYRSSPASQVPDFGQTIKSWDRSRGFALFFLEARIIQREFACGAAKHEPDRLLECRTSSKSVLTLSSGGLRNVRDVSLSWTDELPPNVAKTFAATYGGANADKLTTLLTLTTPQPGRRRHSECIGPFTRATHYFNRANWDVPAEHEVTITAGGCP